MAASPGLLAVGDIVNADINVDGLNYKVVLSDPDDHIQKHMLNGAPYEHTMLRDMANRCRGVVVDAGANIGNHTLYMAKRGFPVFAFEPDPVLASCIVESAQLNGLNHVHVAPIGLGSEPTTARLVDGPDGNVGAQSLKVGVPGVDVLPLDEFDIPASVIKIDVEGMEFKVLYGARKTIAKYRPLLYVEAHRWGPLAKWAKSNGYVRKAKFNASPTYLLVPGE